MAMLMLVLGCAAVLGVAYRIYGALLAKLLNLDDSAATPSHTMRDDVDFVPTEPNLLLSQHFSAIAAAGPIVGPILAGLYFGWLPALIWIVLGAVFIGGVHDMTSLIASVRHKARSIAEVVREHMSRRSYLLFLAFIWVALVYIIVAFTDIVAGSFVGTQVLENGTKITGGATATSSLLYLMLPLVMGVLLRYTKLSVNVATAIFLPLVGVSVVLGPVMPFDLGAMLGLSDSSARKLWDVLLLGYCLVAGALPVWLLLQPRGHLGGYFLYVALGGALVGLLIGGIRSYFSPEAASLEITYPAFTGFNSAAGGSLAPMLFITIACGACSGFHCLIASGTTSKQLRCESDAKIIGYGAMLLEALVALVSLACVMLLTVEQAKGKQPNLVYALGNAKFVEPLGVREEFAISFALLAFTTFVYDTLDVCTRLGRYIVQELTGWKGSGGKWLGTALTAGVPLFFVTQKITNASGKEIAAWQLFWPLFGASNQLLAALALLGVTVWLWRTRRAGWVWLVTGLPAALMYVMSSWALLTFVRDGFFDAAWKLKPGSWASPVPWAATVLVGLALLMLVEALRVLSADQPAPAPQTKAA